MSTTLEATSTVNDKIAAANGKPNFGNGRYSAEMERIYTACQKLLGISPAVSEKIARQAGSDAGAVFHAATASISVGKLSKDGKATIADASKVKGVTITNALHVVRAIQWIDDAGKNGVSYGNTSWALSQPLVEWVTELESKSAVAK